MRMAGTSRAFVSSHNFLGEIARNRAASLGRSSKGSGKWVRGRSSLPFSFVLSMGCSARGSSGWPKEDGAVTSECSRRHAAVRVAEEPGPPGYQSRRAAKAESTAATTTSTHFIQASFRSRRATA